jgi:hypothetical protein
MADINLIIGIAGMILIVAGFLLNIIHKINVKSSSYLWLNIFGCIFLFYYSWTIQSIPFAILQAVWGLAALIKFIHLKLKWRKV